jgi:hypothetical protein
MIQRLGLHRNHLNKAEKITFNSGQPRYTIGTLLGGEIMPEPIREPQKVRLDIPQAIKRAFMHRGLIVGRGKQPSRPAAKPRQQPKSPTPEEMGSKKPLDNQPQDSKSAKGPDSLVELTEKSQDILYEASTVFPFTLFPDTITLDREKLTIAHRLFWRTANITSTPVSEIMSCEANVGPFFGSLHLTFRFFTDNQRTLSFLWRHDAEEMQRLIHGYIIAHRREVDCSNVNIEDLKKLLVELGQGASS